MGTRVVAAFGAALGLWAGGAGAGEMVWEGEVRVIDARTLAGAPKGPVLALGGILPPPSEARCGPPPERVVCRELSALALRDVTREQHLVCEREEDGITCRASGLDVAEWMVRMGWATASVERLHAAEAEARAAGRGMWYGDEGAALAHDAAPARYAAASLPGEEAVRTCTAARESAFARRDYGTLTGIEAVEWFIEETRLSRERGLSASEADPEPVLDPETREALSAAQRLCGLFGGGHRADEEAGATPEGEIEAMEREVDHIAERARAACWSRSASAARAVRVEDLAGMRQIARHTTSLTAALGERLWRARERGDDAEARRVLARARAAFERAERRCKEFPG